MAVGRMVLWLCVWMCLMVNTELSPAVEGMDERTCEYHGGTYEVGEQITQDTCDRCFCTQYGIMCEIIGCPEVHCHDKVQGMCCDECPNGANCIHRGPHGTVLVPREGGCRYAPGLVCYCYHHIRGNGRVRSRTQCFPSLPGDDAPGGHSRFFGYSKPQCANATDV